MLLNRIKLTLAAFATIGAAVLTCVILFFVAPPLKMIAEIQPYPYSWDTIEIGDTPETVFRKCPEIDQSLHEIKADFAQSPSKVGLWLLEVTYDQATIRVLGKYIICRIGTNTDFRDYLFEPGDA